jgi:hypothetical protein
MLTIEELFHQTVPNGTRPRRVKVVVFVPENGFGQEYSPTIRRLAVADPTGVTGNNSTDTHHGPFGAVVTDLRVSSVPPIRETVAILLPE